MTYNSAGDNANNQFYISQELLCLLQWMIEHNTGTLKKIIIKALASGLKNEIQKTEQFSEMLVSEDVQYSIIEFFGTLETLLLETINEQAVQKVLESNLMPAIDHIDTTMCSDATVRSSIEKATHKIEDNPKENPQDLLLKELLKQWKPNKKKIVLH